MHIDISLRKNDPIRIIVDGSNESGKSTVCNIIKSMLTGLTIIETHDYGHIHVIRELQKSPYSLSKHSDWFDLTEKERAVSMNYIHNREDTLIDYLCQNRYDDILVERLLLTTQVYGQILFHTRMDNEKNLKKLAEQDFLLIFTSASFDIISKRIEMNKETKKRMNLHETPEHLTNMNLIKNKLEMYEKEYSKIKLDKIKIDTSTLSEEEMYDCLKKLIITRYKR